MEYPFNNSENQLVKKAIMGNDSKFGGTMLVTAIEAHALITLSIALVCVILLGNGLVIVGYCTTRRLQTGPFLLFVSMAASDFLVGAVVVPMWIYQVLCHFRCENTSTSFFTVYQFFDVFSALASLSHITVFSLERYIAITMPFRHRTIPNCVYYKLITAAWCYAFSVAIVFVLPLGANWGSNRVVFILTTGYGVPIMVIVGLNASAYCSVKNSNTKLKGSSRTSAMERVKREKETATTVIIISGLVLLAWTPFFVVTAMHRWYLTVLPNGLDRQRLISFVKMIHYSNSGVNPFVYSYRHMNVRQTLYNLLLPCVKSKRKRSKMATSTTVTCQVRFDNICSARKAAGYRAKSN